MRRLLLAAATLCLASVSAARADTAGPAPIIGGETTTVGQFPSVVALRVGGGICTGTLVHRDWILTAAHCITPAIVQLPSQQAVTDAVRVHFGTVNLNQSQGTVRRAALTIPKPGFSATNLGANDIGLIKLAEPVTDIEPTPVNLDGVRAPVGTVVTMVGFGATQTGGGGSVGVQFRLENRTSTSCAQFGMSDTNLLCFSQTDNRGKCRGDSGGPSFAQVDGRRTVVGVTSFGDQDCTTLGADTRTDVERDFLSTHIESLIGCESDADCPNEVCFDNRCIAAPFGPRGLGTSCTTGEDCDSNVCGEGPGGKLCTDSCAVGVDATCPDGFTCLGSSGAAGACWPEEDGGCCGTGRHAAPTALLGIGLVALVLRRRRRR